MAQSFLAVARELIDSPEAKAAYADDPGGFLTARGLDGLSPADLEDAVGYVAEAVPAPVARQLAPPTDPIADAAPLTRLAAASAVEAAVVDVEPGTVDLTALVDPSGQLDLPTDSAVVTDVGAEEEGEASDEVEVDEVEVEEAEEVEESPMSTADRDNEDAFGTGAGDEGGEVDDGEDEEEGAESADEVRPGAESDPIGTQHAADHERDALEPTDESPLQPVEPPPEPEENEFEEMI